MLKQDVPLRTGWFGYRKLDVENCIAHIRAAYAAELRLARQTQQGMEETMAQLRQENKALRQRFAQQAAAQAAASVRAEGSDKLQQLTRKLEAAHAEIRRYQTRLFACERQMIALRRENADLEAVCEQAHEEMLLAAARAEKAEQKAVQLPACPEAPEQAQRSEQPEEPLAEAVACCAKPAVEPEPVWQPETDLEKLSAELLHRCKLVQRLFYCKGILARQSTRQPAARRNEG